MSHSTWWCECVDTSTVSAVDLENIIETETPPQSPALMSSETRPLMSSDRRRCSIIVGVDGDDVVCDPKMSDRHHRAVDESAVTSHTSAEQVRSPVSSLPSSPRPDTSTAFSVCPLRLGKTFAFSSVDAEARSATMAAEAFIQRQQEQVGRIAEYSKRSSLIDEAQLAVSLIVAVLVSHCTCILTGVDQGLSPNLVGSFVRRITHTHTLLISRIKRV